MPRVVVTGAQGMLGRALLDEAPDNIDVIGVARADGDLAKPSGVEAAVSSKRPDVVIHAAAYTDVDGCERTPSRAWRDNAHATRLVASACHRTGIRLVYISTDYVFDGQADSPYPEDAVARPINVYGETKLAGERAVAALDDHVIIRTQWLFGPGGRNFVAAILRRARQTGRVQVVADQKGQPTYSRHLARAIWKVALGPWRGILHIAGRGATTWLELAAAAFEQAGLRVAVKPISLIDWPGACRRPRYCVLSQGRWLSEGGNALPPWRQGLAEYVAELTEQEER